MPPDEIAAAVAQGRRSGYRLIDTAAIYRNESGVAERIEQNFKVFDFELGDDAVEAIDELESPDGRMGPDPSKVGA